ncbi:MAG: hypothetical protein GC161_07375 [Planctomycetaceae bacterium]|nr:hypothetical protein [Planctomycetaceae bacterium]
MTSGARRARLDAARLGATRAAALTAALSVRAGRALRGAGRRWARSLELALLTHLPAPLASALGLDAFRLDAHRFGALGEALARRYLESVGWRTLAQRLWAGDAEFDLLLARAGELAAVEVKSRRVPRGEDPARWPAAERVDPERLARLQDAARRLARDTRRAVRVHVLEVYLFEDRRRPWVRLDPAGAGGVHVPPGNARDGR